MGKPGLTRASPRDVACWRVSMRMWRARAGRGRGGKMERQLKRRAAKEGRKERGARARDHTQGCMRAGGRARVRKRRASVRARPPRCRARLCMRAPCRARAPTSFRQARIPPAASARHHHAPRCVCCSTRSEYTRDKIQQAMNFSNAQAQTAGLTNNHHNPKPSSNTHNQWEDGVRGCQGGLRCSGIAVA